MINTAITEILYQLSDDVFEREVTSADTLPAFSYKPVSDTPQTTLDLTEHRIARYQISTVARNSADAATLAKQLRQHLKYLKGNFSGVNITLIKEQQTIPDFSGDPNVHRHIIDFNFHYGE